MEIICITWLVLAVFNILKLMQSDGKDISITEGIYAIFFAPVYTFSSLVVFFIINPWPKYKQDETDIPK